MSGQRSLKFYRVALLLFILLGAAVTTVWDRHLLSSWQAPVKLEIYPVNGDGSPETEAYIATLKSTTFADIVNFMDVQSQRYWVKLKQPLTIQLLPHVKSLPPVPPSGTANPVQVAWWSLKLRYWAYRHQAGLWPKFGTVRLFVVYYTAPDGQALQHSLGLRKGAIGIVHAFAKVSQDRQNNIVIAHEMLHALGASDEYDLANNQPIYPSGYADSQQVPLYPQYDAEIMAGRRPLSPTEASMPSSLARCVIGAKTAFEIGWR
ncbi:MAG: hypothetical protein V4563_12905 [Pseudomonadota bacterium]